MSRIRIVSTVAVLALACAFTPLAHAAGAAHAKGAGMRKAHTMTKVDINTASKEDLAKLPGIGDAIADKIIAGRPFTSKSELLSRGLMNKAEYAKASSHVIAKSAAPAASASTPTNK
jgi:DNA uptake protein ComE-like DNA-binding protein